MNVSMIDRIRVRLAEHPEVPVAEASVIPTDQNLLDFVDSFSFVHFLMDLEVDFGIPIDIGRMPISEITRLDQLAAYLTEQQ